MMTDRERAIAALTCKIPDRIPTFELEYQLAGEVFGKEILKEDDLKGKTQKEIDYLLEDNAEFLIKIYSEMEHSIIPLHWLSEEHIKKTAKLINEKSHYNFLLTHHGDGTFALPDGEKMYDFAYRTVDDWQGLLDEARKMADGAIEKNKRLFDAGIESFILCCDYCYNMGPFVSPKMFRELITPYLTDIISEIHKMGGYAIKHTDGDIMPILDQLIEAGPDAIHSLDPMAGVDIAKVKEITYPAHVAICGNVNCALMQTGTDEEVRESALYALRHGKPGGGYIYCTSNVPFKGLPPERYQMILDIWKENRDY